MGNVCHCTADTSGEFMVDQNYGIDDGGVTECFQYHDTKLEEYKIKFNFYDKFYRETCRPMFLCKFKVFNEMLDEMAIREGCMVTQDDN